MGPTPKELESIKELIQFDHIYYKQEDSSCTSKKDAETESLNYQAITPKSDASTEDSISKVPEVNPSEFLNPVSVVIVESPVEVPVIDLIEEEEPSEISKDSECQSKNFLSVPPQNSVSLMDPLSIDVGVQESSSGYCSPSPSLSDAGYDSSYSVSSPSSDIHSTGSLRDEDLWDETFTELFPSLV